jgi:hypothetical protein
MSPEKMNLETLSAPIISPEKEPILLQAVDNAASVIETATKPVVRTVEELLQTARGIEKKDQTSRG